MVVSFGLFLYGAHRNHSYADSYLVTNLVLAALPLVVAFRLGAVLQRKLWTAWEPLLLTLVWLVLLPNSFYVISDFIHLQDVTTVDVLYDAVMFTSFIYIGVLLGFASLYVVHQQLKRRVRPLTAAVLIGFILLLCSFGIYIGRDLRWNSWDVIFNPGGLLFDISDRVIKPQAYPDMVRTTAAFFVLLGSLYNLAWQSTRLLHHHGAVELITKTKQRRLA